MSDQSILTAEEFSQVTDIDCRHELVAGRIKKLPFREWNRGIVNTNLSMVLGTFVRSHKLGKILGPGTGFLLRQDRDTVISPDIAFVAGNFPANVSGDEFWPGAPDLVIEVPSPRDTSGEVAEKVEQWLAAGCSAVWVVDPKLQTVMIFRSLTDIQIKTAGETLVGDPVVPGFSCPVDELFR